MRIIPSALPEVLIIEPDVHRDERGFLTVAFHAMEFGAAGLESSFVQDNHSRSTRNVIRALHFQSANPQGKLVTAISGEIYDVAVDMRLGSPTFGHWVAEILSGDSPRYMWVPPGFAHGFAVLSDSADVMYKCTTPYARDDQRGVRWNDPDIGVTWPVTDPILSAADRTHPLLRDATDFLPRLAS